VHPVRLPFPRACATLALALAGLTASCSFNPSSLSGGDRPDGAVDPIPDANQRPDADPGVPDASPADANLTAPDGGMVDATVPPDARPRCQEWPRPVHFDPCAIPEPSAELVLDQSGDYVYDTNTGTLEDPGGATINHARGILPGNPEVRIVSVEGLVVGANARLRAVGSRPLLVASWSDIKVDGVVDISSSVNGSGAGANTGTCNGVRAGGQDNEGGGGGGGGGFNGDGGDGGDGSDGEGGGGAKGTPVAAPGTVRGGCRGEKGGRGDGGDGSGTGGAGGGALQLTAQNLVTINGRLHAGGAGGRGAQGSSGGRCGGGGGGSGGLIGLEAPSLAIGQNAVLATNGGGGGEGADGNIADPGDDGQLRANAAAGGSGIDGRGGDGGTGGAQANPDAGSGSNGSVAGSNRGGGGGGGGGAGYIILDGARAVNPGAVLSPAPVLR
jgi:hypothetical protein